jgi:signal transduction histidine kinase
VEIGLTTVRRIATDLRPPVLDHLGLPSAIRWEAIAFRARTGLRVTVRGIRDRTALSADQQIGVFRIFQEALTNVVRHARATAVTVTLTETPRLFVLRVRDNGRGISARERADRRSIGLLGMHERAVLLGGALSISGKPSRGTTVTISVPLARRTRSSKTARRRGQD